VSWQPAIDVMRVVLVGSSSGSPRFSPSVAGSGGVEGELATDPYRAAMWSVEQRDLTAQENRGLAAPNTSSCPHRTSIDTSTEPAICTAWGTRSGSGPGSAAHQYTSAPAPRRTGRTTRWPTERAPRRGPEVQVDCAVIMRLDVKPRGLLRHPLDTRPLRRVQLVQQPRINLHDRCRLEIRFHRSKPPGIAQFR
jgi:hypothetical protein